MTKKECTKLLYLTIKYCIDLWIFDQLFIQIERNYEYYLENREYISRITMTKEQFEEVLTLMKKYCG